MPITVTKDDQAGVTLYQLPDRQMFDMPTLDHTDSGEGPVQVFANTVRSLETLVDTAAIVHSDATLTDLGKGQKLDPVYRKAVLALAHADADLDDFQRQFEGREAKLLEVPKIDQQRSVAAIEAREIRDWFRALPSTEKNETLDRMNKDPNYEIVILALLRSPIPDVDRNVEQARRLWNQTCRLKNPAEVFAIDRARHLHNWARRGVEQVASMARARIKWEPQQLATALLSSQDPRHHGAGKVFGLQTQVVERARMVLQSTAR